MLNYANVRQPFYRVLKTLQSFSAGTSPETPPRAYDAPDPMLAGRGYSLPKPYPLEAYDVGLCQFDPPESEVLDLH